MRKAMEFTRVWTQPPWSGSPFKLSGRLQPPASLEQVLESHSSEWPPVGPTIASFITTFLEFGAEKFWEP